LKPNEELPTKPIEKTYGQSTYNKAQENKPYYSRPPWASSSTGVKELNLLIIIVLE